MVAPFIVMRSFVLALVSVVLACFTTGCGLFGGVSVQTAKTISKPPASVLVYLSVEDRGKPVDSLGESNFSIYENDVLLDSKTTHLQLLPRDTVADGHSVLLLDLSGEIDRTLLTRIARGAERFVEKVSTTQAVTVLVFDGSKDARLVARFPRVEAAEERPLPDLSPFVSGDASRDLNGAVLRAVEVLEEELERSEKAVKLGTVALLARGPDLAGRHTDDALYEVVDHSRYEFYLLAPKDAKIPTAGALGRDEEFEYETNDTLPMILTELGMRVRGAWGRHYLLSYCSPARGGERDVKIVVNFDDRSGGQRKGKAKTTFDATGFDSGCGPMRPILRALAEAEAREREAQAKAEAEAAAERQKAEERAAARKRQLEAERRAKAASDSAEKALGEGQGRDDEEVVAPPTSGNYE